MRKKLRSSRGMTLTEVLVALAVVSLVSMSLTIGVNSATKVYRDSTQLFEAETLCGTILTYLEDEFRFGRNIQGNESKVIYDSQTFGKGVEVFIGEKDKDKGKVKIGKKETADSSFDLLGAKAYTNGLMVNKCEINYAENLVTITIAVGPDESSVYAEHMVKVVPVDD